ncbi:hypothetical protein MAR_008923, partial [Mya arenaria]
MLAKGWTELDVAVGTVLRWHEGFLEIPEAWILHRVRNEPRIYKERVYFRRFFGNWHVLCAVLGDKLVLYSHVPVLPRLVPPLPSFELINECVPVLMILEAHPAFLVIE